MHLLSNLTIVMITYNRQAYALRSLRYWSNKGVFIHVLDGSAFPIPQHLLSGLSSRIEYHHLPVSLHERLRYVIDLIKTPYVIFACEDEFYIPSALQSCMQFLDQNLDFVGCCGYVLGFKYFLNQTEAWVEYPMMPKAHSILEHDNAGFRMTQHQGCHTYTLIYSVTRTDIWKKSMQAYLQKEFPVFPIWEIQFEILICYFGKSKVISELMWLRSDENKPLSEDLDYPLQPLPFKKDDSSLNPDHLCEDWWEDKHNKLEHEEFLDIMASVATQDFNEQQRVKTYIIKTLDSFVVFSKIKKIQSFRYQIKQLLLFFLPDFMRKKIKILLNHYFGFNYANSVTKVAQDFENKGIKVHYKELEEIDSIVLEFHQNSKKH